MEKIYHGTDVGGSLTKVFAIRENEEVSGKLDNTCLRHDGYARTEDYIDEEDTFENKLDLSINISNKPSGEYKSIAMSITNDINGNRWLLGKLARSVSVNSETLYNGMKMKQTAYYLNIISSITCMMEKLGLEEANISLGTLLPPKQYFHLEKEIIAEVLAGKVTVYNNLTNQYFSFEIDKEDIIIKPESVIAFSTCFISKEGKITDIGREYARKFNLVVDIGENTTDIAGIKEGKPEPITFTSFDYAGALLMQYLRKEIFRSTGGYEPTDNELKEAYGYGYLNLGANKEWVGEEISNANKEFAERLFRDFTQTYLLGKDIKMQQIAAIMFIGGGSIKIDKIKSIGEYFMDLVKRESRFTASYSPEDVRFASIKGLADILKRVKQKRDKVNGKALN